MISRMALLFSQDMASLAYVMISIGKRALCVLNELSVCLWLQWPLNFQHHCCAHTHLPVSASCWLDTLKDLLNLHQCHSPGLSWQKDFMADVGWAWELLKHPHWGVPQWNLQQHFLLNQMFSACLLRCLFNFYIGMILEGMLVWINWACLKVKSCVDILIAEFLKAYRPCFLHFIFELVVFMLVMFL